MSKHSKHTTREEQQKAIEKENHAQKRKMILIEFPCGRNNEPISDSVPYKLRDTL